MRSPVVAYGTSLIIMGLAVLLRWLLDPVLADDLPLVTLFGGVALAAWLGGLGPGILAMVSGYLACSWLFIPPRYSLWIDTAHELVSLLAYLITCSILIGLGVSIRASRRSIAELSRLRDRPFRRPEGLSYLLRRRNLWDPAVIAFAVTIAVLLVGGGTGFANARHLFENQETVARTHQVIGRLDLLLSTLKDIETGQRGYLLTEEETYLDPYYEGVRRISGDMVELEERLGDNPGQKQRLEALKATVSRKLEETERTIALARQGNRTEALAIVREDQGQQLMVEARRVVLEMQQEENLLLEQRATESRESYKIALLSIVLPAFVGIGLLGVVFYLVQRTLADRQAAAELLGDQRERFRVTLASIGDAVITTDVEGRVSFLNHAAEVVTGWTDGAARDQPLSQVFRIVNEDTRATVENPALRALREGVTVGLANHTVLIARDGTERPIDDSAAPIRDEEGRVTGCVLIFRDITERRRLERMTSERSAVARHLASIVESSEDAIIGVSLTGTIQSWNAAAERLYGYSAEETVGKPIAMLIPSDRADEEDRLIARILAGERISHFDTVRLTKSGRALDVSLTLSAVRDEQDRIIGTSKTVRDVTLAKQAEKRIYGLMADLKDADRRKDEFLAILAHELRGPLAPIRHLLEIIKRSEQHPERLRQATDTMDRQLAQMVRLVDDLLDVSRITRNKLELRRERVDVADVVSQAVQLCRPFAEQQRHEVSVELPKEPLLVNGDPVRLAQVFSNLLQNAYKYTEPGGRIWVRAARQGSDVQVTIRDTGVGIPPELLPRIFDLFIQVEETLERAHGGLGIGLTLVKQLVLMHEGTVEARSDGPGKGSEFAVRMPLLLEAHEAHRTPPTILDDHQVGAHRILLVDDNRDSVESLAMLLKMLGHETHIGYDGQQAVELAEQLKPDLMLLDIGLPKLNGFEACRRIREQAWGRNILIVALSGWGQDADRKQSEEAGFDYHMVKPLDYTLLMRLLATVAENGDRESAGA